MANKSSTRKRLYAALAILFLLHNDFWNWADSSRLFGLPVGLTYHLAFCLAVALVFFMLVRRAWPDGLHGETGGGED